jgi:hypothetical protein
VDVEGHMFEILFGLGPYGAKRRWVFRLVLPLSLALRQGHVRICPRPWFTSEMENALCGARIVSGGYVVVCVPSREQRFQMMRKGHVRIAIVAGFVTVYGEGTHIVFPCILSSCSLCEDQTHEGESSVQEYRDMPLANATASLPKPSLQVQGIRLTITYVQSIALNLCRR